MKLSQRLTRVGLTFLLLGSVAAVMPQQNDNAMALTGTCTNGDVYTFGQSSTESNARGSTTASEVAGTQSGVTHNANLYAFLNGKSYAPVFTYSDTLKTPGTYTTTPLTNNGVPNSGVRITAPTDPNNTGTITITATFPGNKMLMFPVTVTQGA